MKRLFAVTYFKTHVWLRALEEVARCQPPGLKSVDFDFASSQYFKTHALLRAAEEAPRCQPPGLKGVDFDFDSLQYF